MRARHEITITPRMHGTKCAWLTRELFFGVQAVGSALHRRVRQ